MLKTRRIGYDGKGQAMIRPGTDLADAWQSIGRQPAILEAFVPFEREVSVLAARGQDGTVAAFDVCENDHRHHILALTAGAGRARPGGVACCDRARGPHRDTRSTMSACSRSRCSCCVESGRERVLVNEIAPRVHNSGHWTIEGAETSQFEQHVRAVAGWPLGLAARDLAESRWRT